MTARTAAGRVVRVNGPLVEVEGLPGLAMSEIVEIGADRLPGETVAIRGGLATVQAYEYTGGLVPGDPAVARAEPLPAEEGYPASLSSALAAFYERAGRVITTGATEGSVTIIGAVSPAGGDMTEPVTAHTQRHVRCLWSLDRDLAYARHYPAVSWSGSFSRDGVAVGAWHARGDDPGWPERRDRLMETLAEADRLGALAELMGAGALPAAQRVTLLAGRLIREGLLQQSALSAVDAYCGAARAAALTDAVLATADACWKLAAAGIPAGMIEEQDFSPVLRAREEAATPDDVGQRQAVMLARLGALARQEATR